MTTTKKSDMQTRLFAIQGALLKAQQDIQHVEKTSKNPMGFVYTSIDGMVRAARDVLHKNGLVLSCKGWSIYVADDSKRVMSATYELCHPESGGVEMYSTVIPYPEGGRGEDKQYLGRQSSALKYLLRDLLMLPMLDSNEICAEVDKPQPAKKKPVRKVKKATPIREKFIQRIEELHPDINQIDKMKKAKTILNDLGIPSDGTASDEQIQQALDSIA